jgi:hypothetical protein
LQDFLLGFTWVVEPQTKIELWFGSLGYKFDGCFKHARCKRKSNYGEPFIRTSFVMFVPKFCTNLTLEKKVVQEDATIEKKGFGGIRCGRRLVCLLILKLTTHICAIHKKY